MKELTDALRKSMHYLSMHKRNQAANVIDALTAERDAQRKVLEQALEVIKYIGYVPRADGSHPVEKAITAIQEQLNGQD